MAESRPAPEPPDRPDQPPRAGRGDQAGRADEAGQPGWPDRADPAGAGLRLSGTTAWARSLETPLRAVPAHRDRAAPRSCWPPTLAALVWANLAPAAYASGVGHRAGHPGRARELALDLRGWVNSRADDVLLPGRRAGGAPRVRPGRAARAAAAGPAAGRRAGRACWCRSAIYLAINAGRPTAARLGRGHVDRHRVRARHAGPDRPAAARPGADLPAHLRHRRRPGGPDHHRRRLQRDAVLGAAAGRRGHPGRRRGRAALGPGHRARLRRGRGGGVGGVLRLGRGPDRGRPGRWA